MLLDPRLLVASWTTAVIFQDMLMRRRRPIGSVPQSETTLPMPIWILVSCIRRSAADPLRLVTTKTVTSLCNNSPIGRATRIPQSAFVAVRPALVPRYRGRPPCSKMRRMRERRRLPSRRIYRTPRRRWEGFQVWSSLRPIWRDMQSCTNKEASAGRKLRRRNGWLALMKSWPSSVK
jgi:hypothetical protein